MGVSVPDACEAAGGEPGECSRELPESRGRPQPESNNPNATHAAKNRLRIIRLANDNRFELADRISNDDPVASA